jgi:SAM-dependent methyltransferase
MPSVVSVPPGNRDVTQDASVAFDAFAPFYDILTVHQDYEWWWSELLALAQAAGLSGKRVLDVACGTGKSLIPLLERGWSGTGVDASAGMLKEAGRKLGPDVRLLKHDMRELPALGEFDMVCALNDAVNNVHDAHELLQTFKGFRRNLAAGGIALFDLNTIRTFRGYADGMLAHQEPDRILLTEGFGAEDLQPGETIRLDFVVLNRRERFFFDCVRAPHYQRHHPQAEVASSLAAAELELVSVHGMLGFQIDDAVDELAHEKAVYVARRSDRYREQTGGDCA